MNAVEPTARSGGIDPGRHTALVVNSIRRATQELQVVEPIPLLASRGFARRRPTPRTPGHPLRGALANALDARLRRLLGLG